MTDPWARPSVDGARARRPPAQAVEIELAGPGGSAPVDESGDDEPNWRVAAGAATILGVVLGLVIAGVIVWSGDDGDDESSSTTVPARELATEITAPPTLPPVETVPPTSIGGLERMVDETRTITVPSYPPRESLDTPWPDAPIAFANLDESAVATIITDSAFADGPTDSLLLWDAPNQRFELRFDLPVGTSRTVYDSVAGFVYEAIQRPSGDAPVWTRTAAAGYFPADVDPDRYFARILLGPIREENVDQAIIASRESLTRSVDGILARVTTFEMPESSVVPWGAGDGTMRVTYDVYADQDGRVLRTQGLNSPGGSPVALVHTLRQRDVTIELPDEDDVVDAVGTAGTGVIPTAVTPESLRPNYETVDPVPATSAGPFSIPDAIAHLERDPPAAATVDVLSDDGTTWFTAQRDDDNDRRLMTRRLGDASPATVQIDDAATAATFVTDDVEGFWTRLASTGQGGRLPPVDERLVSGLVPPTAIADATVLAFYRYVVLPDGTIALEAQLRVEPGAVVLPSGLPMRLDADRPVEVYVYVSAGVVHEFHILANQGEPQVLVQRFDPRADPEIALPDESKVVDG